MNRPRRLAAFLVFSFVLGLAPLPVKLMANPFTNPSEKKALPAPMTGSGSGQFYRHISKLQFELRERIAELFSAIAEDASKSTLLLVLAFAFVYGFLHAAGPGHRKTVVFSLFIARKAAWWKPALAGFLSATIHALSAVLLVGVLSLAQGAVAHIAEVSDSSFLVEYASFMLLALISLVLIVRVLLRLAGKVKHEHGNSSKEQGVWTLIIVTSLVPCPGATMVLLFSLVMGLRLYGILAVFAMSLGMAVVISATAYLAWFGRTGLFKQLKNREGLIEKTAALLELASYSTMLLFSLWAASPLIGFLLA